MPDTLRIGPLLALTLLLAPALPAQSPRGTLRRDARWEYTITPLYSLPAGIGFEGGTRMDTSGGLGLAMGLGYNFGEHLTVSGVFQGSFTDYDADIALTGPPPGTLRASSSFGQWTTWFGGDLNALKGPVTPYLSGALGYSWFDPAGPVGLPPRTGCWWDPWYGYTCSRYYPTDPVGAFSYRAGLGLRWDVNPKFFMRAGYERQWHQLPSSEGDPGIGTVKVDFGFFF